MTKNILTWSNLLPFCSFGVLAASFGLGQLNIWLSIIAIFFLVVSVVTAIHHAEVIAHRLGESLGTLVLALSVTIIEVGLIVSLMMANGPDASIIARDTVFAAVMIVSNGIVGLCLILGGLKFKVQGFQVQGASSMMVVLIALSSLTLVLPTFTTATAGPTYSPVQLIFAATASILLYIAFIIFQTKTHKKYFTSTSKEKMKPYLPNKKEAWISFTLLVVSLIAVIGLAKFLAPTIEDAVTSMGAPKAVVGIIIAVIVLLPEAFTAINAARENRLQTSLNLALGSGVASIALTIPVVSAFSLLTHRPLTLGLEPKSLVFLMMTFLIGNLTLGTGKTTALNGAVHVIILFAYFVVAFIP
jgi:Ca2+:H+ antiporter